MVINASAGSVDEPRVDSAVDVLRSKADVQVCRTTMPGELDGVLHRRGGRTLVVVGGDGSLHTVVAALHRRLELTSTVVGLVPLGTTNDFARRNGIPLDPAEAARTVLEGAEHPHELLIDSRGNVVVNAVRVTAHQRSGRLGARLRGQLRGQLGGQLGAQLGQRLHVRVEVDGQAVADFDQPVGWIRVDPVCDRHCSGGLGAVGAAAYAGNADGSGSIGSAPTADPASGTSGAAVEVSFATPWDQLTAPLRRTGLAVAADRPTRVRTRASRVSVVGQWFHANADGEPGDAERSRTWTVADERLRLLAPA